MMLGDINDASNNQSGALRHYARAAKCLPGDLRPCADAARMWRHPAVKALSRRTAADPATVAAAAAPAAAAVLAAEAPAPAALWADKEALQDDVARAMLMIEETQRLARQKKSA